ncbi:HAD family hydrolase [Christiangramia salexigens]|uniref:phosphoglycolate phosphatase n=1 Tax=Christiangramia salexigens TaxID=1913577 RepID=A0A1L3J2D6_9FLAO|nr:HAD hydrolase-like protein [Christiangramia salexigens]APG59287.1 haloacid dehalogenase [Christiangramia salexigens]
MNFSNKKVIFWDFDGVIISSEEIRIYGFKEVLKDYPKKQVEQLLEFHKKNGGLSRYVKFRYFFEDVRGEEVSEPIINNLAMQFSKIMLDNLTSRELLIADTYNFISNQYQNFEMHIVSGSDEKELRELCSQLGLVNFFDLIYGSPTPKTSLVAQIILDKNYEPQDCVLIGDSINDYEAAKINGVDFIGFNNIHLKERGLSYIEGFE